jgi:hypothetical protein
MELTRGEARGNNAMAINSFNLAARISAHVYTGMQLIQYLLTPETNKLTMGLN